MASKTKVRLRVTVAHEGKRYDSGTVVEVDDATAKHWQGLGFADVQATKKATATRTAPRTTAASRSRSTRKTGSAKTDKK